MTKIRLFEYATKIGRTPEELRDELGKLGKPAKSNLSLLEPAQIEALNQHYGGAAAPKKAPLKPASKAEPAGEAPRVAAKPVLRSSPIGVVRVAPPKPVKKSEQKAEEPKAEAAQDAKTKENQAPSAPLTTVITELPARPKAPPRPLTSVSMEIPKVERRPEPPKPEKRPRQRRKSISPRPPPKAPAAGPRARTPSRKTSVRKKTKRPSSRKSFLPKRPPKSPQPRP